MKVELIPGKQYHIFDREGYLVASGVYLHTFIEKVKVFFTFSKSDGETFNIWFIDEIIKESEEY